jgi:carbon-monoxide dehydrogenase small subunit
VVLVKQVPDTHNITGDVMKKDGTMNRGALPAIFNPEDLNALEMALQVKERYGGQVTVLTMGPPKATEVLRESLLLTGAKEGCGVGECGTCLVLADGEPVPSCLVLAADAAGRDIETVEGLAADGGVGPLQAAFVETAALQCGFCTPGMIVAAEALLRANPRPEAAEVRRALAGVLCRCGSYPKVLEAVARAAVGGEAP